MPFIEPSDKGRCLIGLREYLGLRGIGVQENVESGGALVPMQFETATGRIWLDVHHPLVDPTLAPSPVTDAAQMAFQEVLELDAFTLVYDLPEAVERLQLPDGTS